MYSPSIILSYLFHLYSPCLGKTSGVWWWFKITRESLLYTLSKDHSLQSTLFPKWTFAKQHKRESETTWDRVQQLHRVDGPKDSRAKSMLYRHIQPCCGPRISPPGLLLFCRDEMFNSLIPLLRTKSRETGSCNLGDMEQITRRIELKWPIWKPTVGKVAGKR